MKLKYKMDRRRTYEKVAGYQKLKSYVDGGHNGNKVYH